MLFGGAGVACWYLATYTATAIIQTTIWPYVQLGHLGMTLINGVLLGVTNYKYSQISGGSAWVDTNWVAILVINIINDLVGAAVGGYTLFY